MEGGLFLVDVLLMLLLVRAVMRGERADASKGEKPNLGLFAYRERPKGKE